MIFKNFIICIMSSIEAINAISDKISQLLKANLNDDIKLSPTEFAQRCAKVYKEVDIIVKKPSNKDVKIIIDKPPSGLKRWNLYVKQQIASMKEEDSNKSIELRRSSQLMLKQIALKWKNGDNKVFMIE